MNVPDIPLMSMLRERMSWLHQRQDLLSQNVANADTPGYVARDLKPLDFDEALKTVPHGMLMTTNARHIAMTPSKPGKFDDAVARSSTANPNGNAVSLEMEMIKVSDTQAQFAAAANLYAKGLSLMKTAIGRV